MELVNECQLSFLNNSQTGILTFLSQGHKNTTSRDRWHYIFSYNLIKTGSQTKLTNILKISCEYTNIYNKKILFVPRVYDGPPSVLNFMYSIWQDAGIRTQVAATAVRCATNKLHASLYNVN